MKKGKNHPKGLYGFFFIIIITIFFFFRNKSILYFREACVLRVYQEV